jgi:hypothetical protein
MTRARRRAALAPGRLRLLLLSLLLLFVGTAASAGTGRARVIEGTLLVLVIVAAVWDLRSRGRERLVAAALGAGAIVANVLDVTVRIRHLPVAAGAIVAALAGLVVWRAYTSVMRPDRPVGDRILGAISVYLLIGLAWAKVYETLDVVTPGAFRFPADTAWAAHGLPRYAYLSFITLATVGYGDITPATPIAGTLAWLEAVTGQLYLAITVARLVGLSLAEGRGSDTTARS